ncbi:PIN domain-containing protein [Flavobacterium sp.]|uniref:PIN domain-containing protein n=1 Tax=Flavobacterium sp. TaxID=239 RepID=UPI0026345301|nr:PIN domain-containing protein [Flavobacterium sp.]
MATINIKDYKIGFTDQIFFDTNIWLLLYGTMANYQAKEQKIYTDFFQTLLQKATPIFLTSMVISEFANVILRRDFNQWISTEKLSNKDFKKDFVGTAKYEETISIIAVAVNKILKLPNIVIVGDDFNAINKEAILENFKLVDFNDSYYAELAYMNKYKVVTNDKDFIKMSSKIDIISAQV